jgi:hypothetical protein
MQIKFCFEEYFGKTVVEKAIIKNRCENGVMNSMNKKQFKEILQSGFSRLKCEVSDSELQLLFNEVDNDRDGLISFEDYSTFLREYFCNKTIDPVNEDRQPVLDDQSYRRSLVRIGKLIFPQIRNLIIEQDE